MAAISVILMFFGGRSPTGRKLRELEEDSLAIVDAFFARQEQGLFQTYNQLEPVHSEACDDPLLCDLAEPCPNSVCRHDIYDNAVAAIYLVKRGQLERAEKILAVFIALLYPSEDAPNFIYSGLPSNRSLTLLAAAQANVPGAAGQYDGVEVVDSQVTTGNNAWAALAFAHYAAAIGSQCHAIVANDILSALDRARCEDERQGFMGLLPPIPPYIDSNSSFYRSTEHNVDMFALANMLSHDTARESASAFVQSMWGNNANYTEAYAMGTASNGVCDASLPMDGPVAADCQFWNFLADVDSNASRVSSWSNFSLSPEGFLAHDLDSAGLDSAGLAELTGVRFTTYGNGVQWENAAAAAMALLKVRTSESQDVAEEIIHSLQQLLHRYGAVPASVLDGNYDAWVQNMYCGINLNCNNPPGGSDTGMGWNYMRYSHVSATAWTGLLLLYKQGDELANPFKKPKGVPSLEHSQDLTCLPS